MARFVNDYAAARVPSVLFCLLNPELSMQHSGVHEYPSSRLIWHWSTCAAFDKVERLTSLCSSKGAIAGCAGDDTAIGTQYAIHLAAIASKPHPRATAVSARA